MGVQLEKNGQKTRGRIIVIDGNCSNSLGRDILKKNWNELFNTNLMKECFTDDVKLNNAL